MPANHSPERPPGRSNRRRLWGRPWAGAVLAGIAILILGVVFLGQSLSLELLSYPDERVLLEIPVHKGDRFSTLITHSVHLSPVYETYRIEGEDTIVLEATRLKDMGWGVPSTFGNAYTVRGGFMIIEGFETILPALPFRVSAVNNARLLLGDLPDDPADFQGMVVTLGDYAPDGKRITFRVARTNGIVAMFHRLSP